MLESIKVIGVLVCMSKGLKKVCLAVNFLILVNEHFQQEDTLISLTGHEVNHEKEQVSEPLF